MISEDQMQVAARAVHETLHGKGSWKVATGDERSASRHLVRVVLKSVDSAGDNAPQPAKTAPIRTPGLMPRSR